MLEMKSDRLMTDIVCHIKRVEAHEVPTQQEKPCKVGEKCSIFNDGVIKSHYSSYLQF